MAEGTGGSLVKGWTALEMIRAVQSIQRTLEPGDLVGSPA
jgi:hypothetical protein